MISESYKIQDGCWNCRFSFCKEEYDDRPQYFCCADGEKRPPCGSVQMGGKERWGKRFDDPKIRTGMRAWDKWSENREVAQSGKCDRYKVKRKKDC